MALYAAAFWFFAIVVLIICLALFEYYKITIGYDKIFLVIGTLLGAIVPVIIYLFEHKGFSGYLIFYLIFAVFFIFIDSLFRHNLPAPDRINQGLASVTTRIGAGVLGIIYIAFPISHLILIRDLEQGRFWVLFLVCIIVANDTFAYYAGKGLGKHKLSPVVSPKKTVEGALGGLIGGVAVALIFHHFFLTHISLKEISVLAVFIGILGQLSDLFESLIKRSAGVKDSGSILPGHGGALDRIDSLIFPVPFLYYYLIYFRL